MQTVVATAKGDGRANEDYAACGPDWAIILDGATAPKDVDSGCIHDVPWLVRHLAAGLLRGLTLGAVSLTDVLADAIRETREAHAGTCDLNRPDSPSSTVAMIRQRGEKLDYLVLGDSPVILRRGGDVLPVHDDRTDHLPGGRPYSQALVREMRNTPGGFWVASTNVQAAYEAICGSADGVTEAALLTDGVTRLHDWYGASWPDLLAVLEKHGPAALIRRVREAERKAPVPQAKRHDDATAILATSLLGGACPG
jgi:serine/threonine protein phosphatase PrpC